MKKTIIGISIAAVTMTGCAANRIAASSVGIRDDVFREVSLKDPVPAGQADLIVMASVKTRRPDYQWAKTSRGTPDYTLLLNIDGQAIRVKGDLKEEKTASGGSWNPEAGEGIRYSFKANLCLNPGLHRVFVALPEDGVYIEKEITLTAGTYNVLNLIPIYGRRKIGRLLGLEAVSSFYEGIRGFNASKLWVLPSYNPSASHEPSQVALFASSILLDYNREWK